MSKIINFPIERTINEKQTLKQGVKSAAMEKCDVIIFPGVRIERQPRTLSQHATALHELREQVVKTKDN